MGKNKQRKRTLQKQKVSYLLQVITWSRYIVRTPLAS